jgi:hypothetical protein
MLADHRADLELALLHLNQVEQRIVEQRHRVAYLQSQNQSTRHAEDLLATLIEAHTILNRHVARVRDYKIAG